MPKRPIGGKNVKGAGWSAPNVAMGTGVVHIPQRGRRARRDRLQRPDDLQSEYAGIGGAETGADKITRPRQFVLGMLKRDVITDPQVVRDGELRPGDLARPSRTCRRWVMKRFRPRGCGGGGE